MYPTSISTFSVLLSRSGEITLAFVDVTALVIKYKRYFQMTDTTNVYLGSFVSHNKYYIPSVGKSFKTNLGSSTITLDPNQGIIFSSDCSQACYQVNSYPLYQSTLT